MRKILHPVSLMGEFLLDLVSSISFALRSNKISPSLQSASGNISRTLQSNDMELCPKCKSDYLKPTEDPRKLKCNFCGKTETISYVKAN